jgi:oxygen-independent coproporphyrinogen-3 oxidase
VSAVDRYIEVIESGRLALSEREVLSQEQQMIEAIFLGLRMTDGIDLGRFKEKFGINFIEAYKEILSDLEKRDYIEVDKHNCALTRQGRVFLDSITQMFVSHDVLDAEIKI